MMYQEEMDDFQIRLATLKSQGFHCSQILMLLALERTGRKNPDLVRAMGGIAKGLWNGGETCGALLGGACILGFYAGRGRPGEEEDPGLSVMVSSLSEWFRSEAGLSLRSTRCSDILDEYGKTKCPQLVRSVWIKTTELLEANGIDMYEGRHLEE